MEKKILISIGAVIIALAAVSTFFEFSDNMSGKVVATGPTNTYAILTAVALVTIVAFMFIKNKR